MGELFLNQAISFFMIGKINMMEKQTMFGIVQKIENGKVYTIEGNSNDSCKQREYDINSEEILGYGTPKY